MLANIKKNCRTFPLNSLKPVIFYWDCKAVNAIVSPAGSLPMCY